MKQKLRVLFDKRNIKITLLKTAYVLFLLALIPRFINQLFTTYGYESWSVSEFLINYKGGFVRRGLTGEILFFFAKNFHINIEWTIKIVCLICVVAVCLFFVKSFLKRGYSLYILPLCFFLSSGFVYQMYWIRKDYLFFCFLIPILWLYRKENIHSLIKLLIINLLAVFIILSHEVFAFFALPVLFLLLFNQYKKKGVVISLLLSFLCLSPGIVAFLFTLSAHGDYEMAQAIWDSWAVFFSQEITQIGYSIDALGWSSTGTFIKQLKLNFLYIDQSIFSLLVWVITFPVVYYIATNALLVFRKNEKIFINVDKTILSSVLIFQLLCLLPVFVFLSCDYIRVIFYWIASSFAIFLLIPNEKTSELFPDIFVGLVERMNKFLTNILRPSKTTLVFLMLFIGISGCYFVIEWAYKSTMIYNILRVLSMPFIILKTFLI